MGPLDDVPAERGFVIDLFSGKQTPDDRCTHALPFEVRLELRLSTQHVCHKDAFGGLKIHLHPPGSPDVHPGANQLALRDLLLFHVSKQAGPLDHDERVELAGLCRGKQVDKPRAELSRPGTDVVVSKDPLKYLPGGKRVQPSPDLIVDGRNVRVIRDAAVEGLDDQVVRSHITSVALRKYGCQKVSYRQPSLEGTGEVGLRRLIKEALRMRPDRLVVGEVREAEALDLLIALNSGLPGMCSIHANSARDALAKLCTLPLLAGRNIDSDFVVPTVASSIDIVVHCELERSGKRRVAEIIAPSGQATGSTIEASSIFALQRGSLEATGGYPSKTAKFRRAGLDPATVLSAYETREARP